MNCPLCLNDDLSKLETINKNKLNSIYKNTFKIDISYLINENLNYFECNNCRLRFFYPLITGDEKFYNHFQKFDWYYQEEKNEYQYAKKYITSKDKVLEIVAGKGAFTNYITSSEYKGLEFSTNAIEMAKQKSIVIENKSIESYSLEYPEYFDIVVSFQCLEHVANPKSFIESKLKSIKKNGKMIIAVPAEDSFLKYLINGVLNMPPHHVTRWTDYTLKFIAKIYNLEIIDIFHEKLQSIHIISYLYTLIQNRFLKPKLINLSIKSKLFSLISYFFSLILKKGFKEEMLPNGHTVIAVYKKK